MAGGVNECVMGFYKDENGNIRTGTTSFPTANSGFNGYLDIDVQKEDGIPFPTDNKYYQIYQKTASDGLDLGDALYETKIWNDDNPAFVRSDLPIAVRSSLYSHLRISGTFSSSATNGYGETYRGFRVCLAIK